jgi:hypothetical protein
VLDGLADVDQDNIAIVYGLSGYGGRGLPVKIVIIVAAVNSKVAAVIRAVGGIQMAWLTVPNGSQ